MKYTDIRARVAITPDGQWHVFGCSSETDAIDEIVVGGLENASLYWIEARVPIPQDFQAVLLLPDESQSAV
jgi:hypothetical protein